MKQIFKYYRKERIIIIRSRKQEEINSRLIEAFSNKNMYPELIDSHKKSKIKSKDKSRFKKLIHENLIEHISKDNLLRLLKKISHNMNFEEQLKYEIFCAINSALVSIYPYKKQMDERELSDIKELQDIFELLFYLGQSDSDDFLNDE